MSITNAQTMSDLYDADLLQWSLGSCSGCQRMRVARNALRHVNGFRGESRAVDQLSESLVVEEKTLEHHLWVNMVHYLFKKKYKEGFQGTWIRPKPITYMWSCEAWVWKHVRRGASRVGMDVPKSAPRLCHAGGALRWRRPSMDGSGWRRWASRTRESDVLVPGPVVRSGLSVRLMGKLVNLGQMNYSTGYLFM